MIIFSSEKLQIFSEDGESMSYFEDTGKHNLLLPGQEKLLKKEIDALPEAERVVVVPSQILVGDYDLFSGECIDGICSFISRADYYMYLWHANFARHAARDCVIVIEEYDKKIRAQAYQVKEGGYAKYAEAGGISWLRNGKHLLMDLEEKNFFASIRKEEAEFIILSDHKNKEEKKLSRNGMRITKTDSSWEEKWKDGQEFDMETDRLLSCSTVYKFHNEDRRFLKREGNA